MFHEVSGLIFYVIAFEDWWYFIIIKYNKYIHMRIMSSNNKYDN